jgi:hypothetical protein
MARLWSWIMILNVILQIILTAMLATHAHGQTVDRLYDRTGTYRGRIEPDYSGQRNRVLDEQGRRLGTTTRDEPRSTGPSPDIRGNAFWKEIPRGR